MTPSPQPPLQESFLEDINNILNAGEVPNLLGNDDMEAISAAMRPLMVAAGLPVTKVSIYSYFVNRVRSFLHLVLCFRCVWGLWGGPGRTPLGWLKWLGGWSG